SSQRSRGTSGKRAMNSSTVIGPGATRTRPSRSRERRICMPSTSKTQLYFPDLVGGNVVIVVLGTEGFLKAYGGDAINPGGVRFGLWKRPLLFEFLLHH